MLMRLFLPSLAAAIFLSSATLSAQPARAKRPATPPAANFDDLEISLNGASQKARIHIADLGDLATGQTQSLKITVRNISMRRVTLDMFPRGDSIEAVWNPAEPPVVTRKGIDPGSSASIDIRFTPPDPGHQTLQMLTMFENAVPVTSVVIGYLAHPPTITLPIVTPPYQSALGTQKSVWYTVPSGPAPLGYTYLSNSFGTAGSDPAGNSRSCGNWVDCEPLRADDFNVVWRFRIQGYEHDWTHSDSSVQAVGALTVVYTLKPPAAPVLKTVEK
jgi:hypothetical protein